MRLVASHDQTLISGRTMEHSTAVQVVFHIPELLENILRNLDVKELLLCQRVSRDFRRTVEGSLRLRRKLFFAPDWELEARLFDAYASNNRPGQRPDNNRLLRRAFPGSFPSITLVVAGDNEARVRLAKASSRPGSSSSTSSVASKEEGHREHWSWDVCISFPADKLPDSAPAVHYPEASWRKMLLCQPPCQTLHLVRRWQRSMRPALVVEDGITMGDLVEAIDRRRPSPDGRKWHESYISSDRDWHFEGNIRCNLAEQ